MAKSVLSIQSHVSRGYVGNKAVTLPLQLRGWGVDAVNTVSLSNHTGYSLFGGNKATANDVLEVYKALKQNKFEYKALLTGYAPSAEVLEAVCEIASDLKEKCPELVYVLDPVLGDNGKLYVPQESIEVYRSILRCGVSLVTPNGFEAATLCGFEIDSRDALLRAVEYFDKDLNVPNLVITSLEFGEKLVAVAWQRGTQPVVYNIDRIPGYFTGTGDLFAGLVLDEFVADQCLANAVSRALGTLYAVLVRTDELRRLSPLPSTENNELRLVECVDLFRERLEVPFTPLAICDRVES